MAKGYLIELHEDPRLRGKVACHRQGTRIWTVVGHNVVESR